MASRRWQWRSIHRSPNPGLTVHSRSESGLGQLRGCLDTFARSWHDGTNRAWIVPTAELRGKAVPEREMRPGGFWCVPYRTCITFYWRQQDQVTHKTNTKNPPISRFWGIFGFPLIFYTVVLKWKFLSKKIPLKGRKRQGIVVKILQNSWFNLAFLNLY